MEEFETPLDKNFRYDTFSTIGAPDEWQDLLNGNNADGKNFIDRFSVGYATEEKKL